MNVGFLATRLAGTDGVSLETAKLADLLARMGHRIAYCAGELDEDARSGTVVDEMHFRHPEVRAIHDAAFLGLGEDTRHLRDRIAGSAERIRYAIRRFVRENDIDLLVSENASAIPMNIPLGVALSQEVAERGTQCIGHHHDFAWERERFGRCAVQDLIDEHFPPKGAAIRHVVISTIARRQLRARRGIDSIVLPNVMDFAAGVPHRACRTDALRAALGFGANDVVLLQPTRVVPRKGIELAIDLAAGLADVCLSRPVRLLLSHRAGDEGTEYLDRLRRAASEAGVDLVHACDSFPDACTGGKPGAFDLRDAYECADFVTYPSSIEGFGNALLEAVFHRRPVLVNRYPVYVSDIGPCGFDFVEIDGRVDAEAIDQVSSLLDAPRRVREMTDHNYDIAARHFSYEVAQNRLDRLLEEWSALS